MTNEQAVVLAVWFLTGGLRAADVEDVAIKADGLAPGRFRWRKYKEQINLQSIGKSLRDAKEHGFTKGTSAVGWSLTETGFEEARRLETRAGTVAARAPVSAPDRAWRRHERLRLLNEPAYGRRRAGEQPSEREILSFFRLDAYVVGDARRERISRLQRVFSDDAALATIVSDLAAMVKDA